MNIHTFITGLKRLILPLGVSAAIGFSIVSCSQKEDAPVAQTQTSEEKQEQAIRELLRRMPNFELKTEDGKTLRVNLTESNGFSFSNPPSETGYNYTESTGTYTFVASSSTNGTVAMAASGFGGNASGGKVSAGNYSYDMAYTFCLTADDEGLGLGLFDDDFTGVSMVVGVSGDFNKIADGMDSDSEDFENLFPAIAFYVVYAEKASGSYKVLNWLNDQDLDEAALKNKGFAAIIDFGNGKVFFSKSGELNVSGGSISFSGTYLEVTADFGANYDDLNSKEVSGVGAMGCN
jgi:hypothetical protein